MQNFNVNDFVYFDIPTQGKFYGRVVEKYDSFYYVEILYDKQGRSDKLPQQYILTDTLFDGYNNLEYKIAFLKCKIKRLNELKQQEKNKKIII